MTAVTPPSSVRKNIWLTSVREEPFRLLFPVGLCFGLLGAGHWLLYGLGITGHYSGFFHASLQVQGFMASFVLGFIFTAWPKFTVGPVAKRWELIGVLAGSAAVVVGVFLERAVVVELGTLLQLLVFGLFAWPRYWRRATTQPPVLIFLTVAYLHALVGVAMLLWVRLGGVPALELLGRRILWQGSLLAVVLGMGGHLIPRVLGMPEGVVEKHAAARGWAGMRQALVGRETAVNWLLGALLLASFLVEDGVSEQGGRLLRAAVVSGRLVVSTHVWRLPRVRATFIYGLWSSVWLVALGVWAAALTHRFHVACLHLVFIGGFSLLALTIGARVTLSHGGYMRLEARNRWMQWVMASVIVAMALRVAADTSPEHYFKVAAGAAGVWMVGCLLWAIHFVPKMVYREFPVVRPTAFLRVVPPKQSAP